MQMMALRKYTRGDLEILQLVENARSMVNSLLFDARRCLAKVGRYKYNKKLGILTID